MILGNIQFWVHSTLVHFLSCSQIFGTVTTCRLRLSEKFYGRGESSLYSFDSPTEMNHYYWTGQNYYIVKGNSDSLSIGSGE